MSRITPVIMCGGSGTRLWPLSRRLEPKQFQKLVGETSLFQDTLARFENAAFGPAVVLVNAAHQDRVRLELHQAAQSGRSPPRILVEPAMRSTAPAIAAAAAVIAGEDPDAIMLVVPSDHRIGRPERLQDAYLQAFPFVEAGGIALFGIRPSAPETGFGYICSGERNEHGVDRVDAFVEKPDIERATQLVADPRYTWNSGIFMFRASTILEELANHAPTVLAIAAEAAAAATRRDGAILLSASYGDAPEISIDHAVMEHSRRLGVVPVSPDWNDLGSFEALWEIGEHNGEENVMLGEVMLRDVRRSYIRSSRRLVSVVGLSNIVVVDTDDVLLVASRAQSQDVKFIAQQLARDQHPAADRHVVQQHEGGSRRVLEAQQNYRVEHLTIFKGCDMRLAAEETAPHRTLTLLSGRVSAIAGDAVKQMAVGGSITLGEGSDITLRNHEGDQSRTNELLPAQLLLTTTFAEAVFDEAEESRKKVG